ncbi:MAG: hypothetical protein QOE56_964 [Solirubrobacterales bacterium]|nr:hypothetical protein [Solirubrobacterales bacterium]
MAERKRLKEFKNHFAVVGASVVVLVAAVGVYSLVSGRLSGGGSSNAQPFEARMAPAEFLYLDGARILGYVAQLEGGEIGTVHRISKEISQVSGEATANGLLKIGASSQHENLADSTITRTESSELGLMLDDLRRDPRPGVSIHPITLDNAANLNHLREGWLVRFATGALLSPGYIRPYVVVRQSATLAALFPQAAGNQADAERAEIQRRKAESFAKQIGPNPRITFAVAPPRAERGAPSLKVLMPMRYRNLTDERSLLEKGRDQYTGGKLIVIGKVIRIFKQHGKPCEVGDAKCLLELPPEYTDFATQEIWRSPLEQASNYLIEKVSHSCRTPRTREELVGPDKPSKLIEGRACFLAKLKRQTQLYAPGVVILPLAVYK